MSNQILQQVSLQELILCFECFYKKNIMRFLSWTIFLDNYDSAILPKQRKIRTS